jgi:hypothetical protein
MFITFESFLSLNYYERLNFVEYTNLLNVVEVYTFNRVEISEMGKFGFVSKGGRISSVPFLGGLTISPEVNLEFFPVRDLDMFEVDGKIFSEEDFSEWDKRGGRMHFFLIENYCLFSDYIYITKLPDEYYLVKYCGDIRSQSSYGTNDMIYFKCDQLDGVIKCVQDIHAYIHTGIWTSNTSSLK